MATLAANPPNAPETRVITVGFLCVEKIPLHPVIVAIRGPIGEIFGFSLVVICLSFLLLSTIYDTLF